MLWLTLLYLLCPQISAEDARRGAVRVEAKAPSGRTHEMAIGESNGVYTANFTPTEVGKTQTRSYQAVIIYTISFMMLHYPT